MFRCLPSLVESCFQGPFTLDHCWLYQRYLFCDFERYLIMLKLSFSSLFPSSFSFDTIFPKCSIFSLRLQSTLYPFLKSSDAQYPESERRNLLIFDSKWEIRCTISETHVRQLYCEARISLHYIYLRLECFKDLVPIIRPHLDCQASLPTHLE